MKRRVYDILDVARRGDQLSRYFDFFIISLIALNVLAVILETVPSVKSGRESLFRIVEAVSVVIFTAEYVLRIWSCTINPSYRGSIAGRVRCALTPLVLVDLLAILPFYVPMLLVVDLRVLRVLRLLRIFRLLKLGRYSDALQTLARVFRSRLEELVITGFVVFVLLILTSSCMYYAEHDAQPDAFPSIPAAMWWGIGTLSTLGYGDVVPITSIGKLLGAFVALLGVGVFALPAGILGGGFVEEINKRKGRAYEMHEESMSLNEPDEAPRT